MTVQMEVENQIQKISNSIGCSPKQQYKHVRSLLTRCALYELFLTDTEQENSFIAWANKKNEIDKLERQERRNG